MVGEVGREIASLESMLVNQFTSVVAAAIARQLLWRRADYGRLFLRAPTDGIGTKKRNVRKGKVMGTY